eukprot:CAMPEP_0181516768 /NCGR_PEP_ID=MMETSP1110-20121109/64319_1 /TAXON_ID=174948 /ORGANISM="Symbiodinium sp., Strain CCMP421" /LENGTH=36 /DNA_ID= /DNA_START= /DNA_END= /DNA_ORIENTATION=
MAAANNPNTPVLKAHTVLKSNHSIRLSSSSAIRRAW